MKFNSKKSLITLSAIATLFTSLAHAMPSREEVYRSEKLKTIVYRDGAEKDIYWYLPPVRLVMQEGTKKTLYYKRKTGDQVTFYFYVEAYMNEKLENFIAGEVGGGLLNRSQFKPVIVKKFGLQVPQYGALAASDEVTDYHYLNSPHLIKMPLSQVDADEFEFFLNNQPGIQTNVVFNFMAEKQDKWLTVELTHKEVYRAMGIGAGGSFGGKYLFTKAQIDYSMRKYIANKMLDIRGKGDLPIPDIVNEVIKECFTPIYKNGGNNPTNPNNPYNPYPNPSNPGNPTHPGCGYGTDDSDCNGCPDWDNDCPQAKPPGGGPGNGNPNKPIPGTGTNTGNGGGSNPGGYYIIPSFASESAAVSLFDRFSKENSALEQSIMDMPKGELVNEMVAGDNPPAAGNGPEVSFQFKMELANDDQTFMYKDIRFADTSETASIPVYLTAVPKVGINSAPSVTSLGTNDFIVEAQMNKMKPLRTGIIVGEDEQYTINAVFSVAALSPYGGEKKWYRADIADKSVTQELYYRVGSSPWIPLDTDKSLDGRAVIKVEMIEKGELQFALNREGVWSKIRDDLRESKMGGLVQPVLYFKDTYPQFNIQVTGRKYEFSAK